MIRYSNLSTSNTGEGYLYISLEGDYTKTSCRKLLKELNEECLINGYEAVMISLGQLSGLSSISDVWRELATPEAISILPFRIAWVNGGEIWDKNWQRMVKVIRDQSLNWYNFSDIESAEKWLALNRIEALA